MKTKAVAQKEHAKKKFFFLMIVPFFIGLMIAFIAISNANRDLQHNERVSSNQPLDQGWKKYDGPTVSF